MAYKGLWEFINRLEQEGELIRITTPVSPHLEITEITDRVSKMPHDKNKALLFENVEGHEFPVVINLYGNPRRMAWALGVDDLEDLHHRLAKVIDPKLPKGMGAMMNRAGDLLGVLRSLGIGPSMTGSAAVQQVVITDNPDVSLLPIIQCWPDDGGKYITMTQVITREPEAGLRNVGMYRIQVYDGQHLGLHWQRHKGGKEHQDAAQKSRQSKIPVAIVLGGDPAAMWSASAPLPPGIDEYLLASWLRGKPVKFVKCVSQELEVPADADFVIEGWFDPNEHRMEGPFGDHTGFYTPQDLFPVMHVTAITHRADAVYPTTIVGKPPMEDLWMGAATERLFLPLMKLFLGEIIDYHMPAEGVFHNLVLVRAKTRYPGHPQKIMYGLWGLGLMMLAKAIVIVDADVDVQDYEQVANAIFKHVDWRRDITIVDGPVDQLDHSAIRDSYGGKIGIDATHKAERESFASPQPVDAEAVTDIVGEKWTVERETVLIISFDKRQHGWKEQVDQLWRICPDYNIIVVDAAVDVHNLSDVAWRTLGNVDWRRDIIIKGEPVDHFDTRSDAARGQIAIDASAKNADDGHARGWPDELVMSPEMVQLVDEKWSQYGIE